MFRVRRRSICVVVGVALAFVLTVGPARVLLAELAGGKAAGEATEHMGFVVVKTQELEGTVSYPDGRTFAREVPVRVWSIQDEDFIHETATDGKGAYKLPDLAPGRYLVCFADRVVVEVRVDEAAEPATSQLDVVIPHGKGVFAQMVPAQKAMALMALGAMGEDAGWEADGGGGWGSPLLRTVLFGAGGAATAVAFLAVTENLGDEDKKIVSP